MIFDELDTSMRRFETSLDQTVLPELYMAVRIDGRNFTKLTKETCRFEAPFDVRFRDAMVDTVRHLMDCGFRIVYGYTQSDEISLLFHPKDNTFGRKTRKINSVLAGEASAFSPCIWGYWPALTAGWCRCPIWNACGIIFPGGRRMPTGTP